MSGHDAGPWATLKGGYVVNPAGKIVATCGIGMQHNIGVIAMAPTAFAALEAIQAVLSGKEWDPSSLEDIAGILNEAGFTVLPYEPTALHFCRVCGEACDDGADCCNDDFPEPGDIEVTP